MTPQDSQATASNCSGKRKVALITGITGQVIRKIKRNSMDENEIFRMEVI